MPQVVVERWLFKQEIRPGKPISLCTLANYKRIWGECLEGKILGYTSSNLAESRWSVGMENVTQQA